MTEKVRYFVSGDYELIQSLCRGQFEFINELRDVVNCHDTNGRRFTKDFLLEFDSKEIVLKIHKRAKELEQKIEVWRKQNSISFTWQVSDEALQKWIDNLRNPPKQRRVHRKPRTKNELLKDPRIKKGSEIKQPAP